MKPQSNSSYGINRLESKTARAAIIQKIASDFNLMPQIQLTHQNTTGVQDGDLNISIVRMSLATSA